VLFNYLFAYGQARREGKEGTLILRIEDTDQTRLVEGAAQQIVDVLTWFGLTWDEGPDKGGPHGPYVQSQRLDMYQEAASDLVSQGKAYRCFCSKERLQEVRESLQARGLPPGYDRHCRNLPQSEIDANLAESKPFTVRFAMPRTGETVVTDLIRGDMTFQNELMEDLVLLKSDGYPTYHLGNVVDDHDMEITHIMRGDEWIATAPIHVQLYKSFGWDVPAIAHMPLILAPGGGKLSKRHGSTAMEEFRQQGYLPEALMNYLVLLGWSLDGSTEMLSKDEMLENFTLERVSPSPATFDYTKLAWFNQQYINHVVSLEDLVQRIAPYLMDAGMIAGGDADPGSAMYPRLLEATRLLKDRFRTLAEAPELMGYFLQDDLSSYDPALLVPKKTEPDQVRAALSAVAELLPTLDLDDIAGTEAALRSLAEEQGLKAGQLFMPIRVAVCGRPESPGLFETLRAIGPALVARRIGDALAILED
jgi:glutamyl-tRNA synthetase